MLDKLNAAYVPIESELLQRLVEGVVKNINQKESVFAMSAIIDIATLIQPDNIKKISLEQQNTVKDALSDANFFEKIVEELINNISHINQGMTSRTQRVVQGFAALRTVHDYLQNRAKRARQDIDSYRAENLPKKDLPPQPPRRLY